MSKDKFTAIWVSHWIVLPKNPAPFSKKRSKSARTCPIFGCQTRIRILYNCLSISNWSAAAKRVALARKLNHFQCPKAGGCRSCRDLELAAAGKAKFVGANDFGQEVYVVWKAMPFWSSLIGFGDRVGHWLREIFGIDLSYGGNKNRHL